jgi:hypothetical protein
MQPKLFYGIQNNNIKINLFIIVNYNIELCQLIIKYDVYIVTLY